MANGKTIDWTTFIIFLAGVLVSSQAAIMGYIPLEYVPLASIAFGALSQIGSLLRNGQENDENFQNGYSSASDDTVKYE